MSLATVQDILRRLSSLKDELVNLKAGIENLPPEQAAEVMHAAKVTFGAAGFVAEVGLPQIQESSGGVDADTVRGIASEEILKVLASLKKVDSSLGRLYIAPGE